MRVGPTYWGPLSCKGLLYSCCISVVQESNPLLITLGWTRGEKEATWQESVCMAVIMARLKRYRLVFVFEFLFHFG
jgi:hypothetical protein